ncbi:MAG: hypothetical protein A2508_03040 [Candidatus Lambdaproteobacteria bacterium RIFOXYD12_FULL_49_8]|uniref:Uncharacterized protein n=1 Tax=Candidatus Lambdaproteobacteria bacterium RIFOXYD2_FULL_50_16 TaxID=1817772 RepID=A0A1F6GD74_9PROT|nr:MAG: hypothetical protein A2527_12110 [Candidatus Lambdaproteobacteria bacterium RIFOXYD2_FULL_50_16]OGG97526.1 MAG: hypothetical protein A2508_03040 [Candidatus Lambdaproteobacteria bacterium RIFOXYD12_FULL_49_8]
MIKVDIYPKERLIVAIYNGDIRMADAIEATGNMIVDPNFSPEFDGVIDYRQAELLFSVQEIIDFSDAAAKSKITGGRWCTIVSRPQETALLSIFKNHLKDQHPVELFCTINAASEYLGRDLSKYLLPDVFH